MILIQPRKKNKHKKQLEHFLIFLWDFGLEVGHSVRTIKECQYEAKKDITTMTNIMEARCIIGNNILFEEMCKLTSPKKIWSTDNYFEKKIQEQKIVIKNSMILHINSNQILKNLLGVCVIYK